MESSAEQKSVAPGNAQIRESEVRNPIAEVKDPREIVILSEAKDLFFSAAEKKQVLRFAQDDNS